MILYTRGARGAIHVWEIEINATYLSMRYGHKGGVMHEQREYVVEGKQGRNVQEQLESRFWSRVNKMRDRGYVDNIKKLSDKVFNKLGFKRPMLAQPLSKVNEIDWSTAIVQPKYDGHRCLVTNHLGEIIAYSRNGKFITSISHILDYIEIPEGMTIDGELYCHGISLQQISSYIKREQVETSLLQYVVYDVMEDMPYLERFDYAKSVIKANDSLKFAPVIKVFNKLQAKEKMMEYRESGYEGAILRHGPTSYQDGYRSKSLVKIKTTLDAYFEIIDIEPSREGWGILVCLTEDGKRFNVSAPGTIEDKEFALRNKHRFVGRDARVEFAYYTPDGIPFHPVAVDIGRI